MARGEENTLRVFPVSFLPVDKHTKGDVAIFKISL